MGVSYLRWAAGSQQIGAGVGQLIAQELVQVDNAGGGNRNRVLSRRVTLVGLEESRDDRLLSGYDTPVESSTGAYNIVMDATLSHMHTMKLRPGR
ncbi:MAG: hypothetical protein EOO27_21385 [Comamonadaceae bacterium]|nr:MAG: hypothetical protein EOO27_21385 [Comamonadaceae bacterium]